MTNRQEAARASSATVGNMLSLELSDVTGTHTVVADEIEQSLPAGAVARAVASQLALPDNVPWSLHDDRGAFLNDEAPIGDQVTTGAKLWVTPKTHLG